jgi:hypothetical protein
MARLRYLYLMKNDTRLVLGKSQQQKVNFVIELFIHNINFKRKIQWKRKSFAVETGGKSPHHCLQPPSNGASAAASSRQGATDCPWIFRC